MSSNSKINVKCLLKQKGNTCGAHSIYNYLVLTNKVPFTQDEAAQKEAITAIYQKIISPQTGEAALPHLMLAFLNQNGSALTLYGSNKFKKNLEEIRSILKINDTINYADDPFSTSLNPGSYGIALWNNTETFPPLDQLATMHYTVVYKNVAEEIYALDSNLPNRGWQLITPDFYLKFMGLLFA